MLGILPIKGKVWLAPMAAVSDVAFRALCKNYGAAATPTEFLSANALARETPNVIKLTQTAQEEDVRIIQIFGQNVDNIIKAVKWIQDQNRFHCIDINLGCPSPKMVAQGACSALLRRPDKIKEILLAIKNSTDLPYSIKLRTGMDEQRKNGMEIIQTAVECGVHHVAIHGRTVKQAYSGKADWDFIKQAVEVFSIPIIANGDIIDADSALSCLNYTKAHSVMVGRAARANPFVFTQINAALNQQQVPEQSSQEKLNIFFEYIKLFQKYEMTDVAILKSHAMQFTKSVPGGNETRRNLAQAKTVEDIHAHMQTLGEQA